MVLLPAMLLSAHAAAVGDPIDEAIAVHVTNRGLEHVGDAVQAMVPQAFPVSDIASDYVCSEDDAAPLHYELAAMDLQLSADEVELIASEGRLDLTLYATLSSTASTLVVTGDCSILTDLDETCGVELPTTAVQAHLGMTIAETDGYFDVTVDDISVDISPVGNPLSDCTLSSAIGTMLGQNPSAVTDLLMGYVEPSLADLGPTIEQSLEDALNSLSLDTSFSFNGVDVGLSLYPSLLQLDDNGLVLGMGALVAPDQISDCVDSSAGSDLMGTGWPDFAATASGTSLEQDAALYIGRDFMDHALYSLWAGGLLCIDVGDFLDGGLSAGVLGGMMGDDFSALVPEDAAVSLATDPVTPPVVEFAEDGAPLWIAVDDLGLPVIAELDQRDSRVCQVDVAADIGVDIYLGEVQADDTGGAWSPALVTELAFSPDDVDYTESYSDLLAPGYSAGLASLVDTMLAGLIPADALPTVAIPDLMGIQLDALVWLPTQDGAWQAGYLLLDTSEVTPIEVPSCSIDGCEGGSDLSFEDLMGCSTGDAGGCGGAGCEDTACSTARWQVAAWRGRLGLLLALGLGIGWRRRER